MRKVTTIHDLRDEARDQAMSKVKAVAKTYRVVKEVARLLRYARDDILETVPAHVASDQEWELKPLRVALGDAGKVASETLLSISGTDEQWRREHPAYAEAVAQDSAKEKEAKAKAAEKRAAEKAAARAKEESAKAALRAEIAKAEAATTRADEAEARAAAAEARAEAAEARANARWWCKIIRNIRG